MTTSQSIPNNGPRRGSPCIIGAARAGDFGIKIRGRKALAVSNRGGQGRGFIEETGIIESAKSGKEAYLKMARRLGWEENAAETLWAEGQGMA